MLYSISTPVVILGVLMLGACLVAFLDNSATETT